MSDEQTPCVIIEIGQDREIRIKDAKRDSLGGVYISNKKVWTSTVDNWGHMEKLDPFTKKKKLLPTTIAYENGTVPLPIRNDNKGLPAPTVIANFLRGKYVESLANASLGMGSAKERLEASPLFQKLKLVPAWGWFLVIMIIGAAISLMMDSSFLDGVIGGR